MPTPTTMPTRTLTTMQMPTAEGIAELSLHSLAETDESTAVPNADRPRQVNWMSSMS